MEDKEDKPYDVSKEDNSNLDRRFGYGSCKPQCLQPLNKIGFVVFWFIVVTFLDGFGANGIADASIPTLERQFQLTSAKSSLIPASQDIGVLTVVLFVSFIGGRNSKPHWIAIGCVVMAIGSLVFMIPHLAEPYDYQSTKLGSLGFCDRYNYTADLFDPLTCGGSTEKYLAVFVTAQVIQGIGFSPMFTLGTVYIDESVESGKAAMYIGLTFAARAVGIACGFFVAGYLLGNVFVDFDRIDVNTLDFDSRNVRWVGAWWVGFIATTVGFTLIAIPIFGLPKYMPGNEKAEETEQNLKKDSGIPLLTLTMRMLKSFFLILFKLIKNPVYVFLKLGGVLIALIVYGIGAFAFKMISEQFSTNSDTLGILMGCLMLTGAVGMAGGGILIRVLKFETVGMLRTLVVVSVMACLMGISLIVRCPETLLAGLQVKYSGETLVGDYSASCHSDCRCEGMRFNPVCGKDDIVYYSACHAGCEFHPTDPLDEPFTNCSCVAERLGIENDYNATASIGRCDNGCNGLAILAPCLFIMMLLVMSTTTPAYMATLRCVEEDDRTTAAGLSWVIVRLLGHIPGPVLLGAVIDRTCLIWQTGACDDSQYCVLYSRADLSTSILIWWVLITALAAICYLTASVFAMRTKSVEITKF